MIAYDGMLTNGKNSWPNEVEMIFDRQGFSEYLHESFEVRLVARRVKDRVVQQEN